MKKIFLLATAALLITGGAFAQDKKCVKGKSCCDKNVGSKKAAEAKNAKAITSAKKA